MIIVLNALRGMLIGVAEIIPGVSGGTVALVVGVYSRILESAEHVLRALGILVVSQGGNRLKPALTEFGRASWSMLIPLLFGMVLAIFLAAAAIESLLEGYPSLLRAAFAGMILVSIYVPWKLSGASLSLGSLAIISASAALSFFLVGLPRFESSEPSAIVIFLAAAVAVCALVLPGVSGSFLLLTLGMYAPTIAAVTAVDFGYLGIFIFGAIVGLAGFTFFLNWLLRSFKTATYLIMTGLMLGSLRALWPWQDDAGIEQAASSLVPELVSFAGGAAAVLVLLMVQRKIAASDVN